MKAKWKELSICDNLPYLIVESGPTIKGLYVENKDVFENKGVLILGIDSPSLLNKRERETFSEHLNNLRIPFLIVGSFIWIGKKDISKLFEKADFGSSGDSCFFINKKPDNFLLNRIPRVKGIFKKKFEREFLHVFDNYDPDTIYVTNEIPDLLIVTKDERMLEKINKQIRVA